MRSGATKRWEDLSTEKVFMFVFCYICCTAYLESKPYHSKKVAGKITEKRIDYAEC